MAEILDFPKRPGPPRGKKQKKLAAKAAKHDAREREALASVIAALDAAVGHLPAASEWKWACSEIRQHMASDVGLPPLRRGA